MTTTAHRAAPDTFDQVGQSHWFGLAELPGESVDSPALRIVPDVDAVRATGETRHRIRYTGYWNLVHVPTGHALSVSHWLPLPWLRRFARLLATGIDWQQVDGDPNRIDHPQYMVVRALGDHVLDCWRRGVPVGPGIGTSLHVDVDGYSSMRCGNRHCDDESSFPGHPAVLLGMGEDGQDEARSHDIEDLSDLARCFGWSQLDESGRWLCETCTQTHQPAPRHIARRIRA